MFPSGAYRASELQAYYMARPHLVLRRLATLGGTALKWLLQDLTSDRTADATTRSRQRAARVVEAMSQLGPAFVKLGQAASTRPDIFSEEVLDELATLQSSLPTFNDNDAMRLIEGEMRAEIDDLFTELTAQPVAAASIGQVYRGRLRCNGAEVAVKVQRPGIRSALALDVLLSRLLASTVMRVANTNSDLPALVDEFAAGLFAELDYRLEAQNGERFRAQLMSTPEVKIPKTYIELSTERVLITEWVDGTPINKLSRTPEVAKRLVEVGVIVSMAQLLDQGFYHADPHPGNLLMTDDGRLCYLDFGMMGSLDRDLRYGLISALVHLVNKEFGAVGRDLVSLQMLPADADQKVLAPALTKQLIAFMGDDSALSDVSFSSLTVTLSRTMRKYKFRIPPYYTLIIRSLGVLEGVALTCDPQFKVLRAAFPWVARRLLSDPDPSIRQMLVQVLYQDGKFQYRRLETLLEQASRQARVASAAEKKGGGEGKRAQEAAVLAGALAFLLSEKGDFLLDVLLTELVVGMESMSKVQMAEVLRDVSGVEQLLPPEIAPLEADVDRVEGLTHLVRTLATMGLPGGGQGSSSSSSTGGVLLLLQEVLELLPPPARENALNLPARLVDRIRGRAASILTTF